MSTKDTSALSARQSELLSIMCKCFNGKPDINMEKFTALGGFGNIESARANLHKVLRKVMSDESGAGADGEASPGTAKKKATPRKRKGAGDDGDDTEETPTKKQAKPKKAGGKNATTAGAEDGEDEQAAVKDEAAE